MTTSKLSQEQKKQRLEELNKLNKKRALTQKEALESMQLENNWTDEELKEFSELAEGLSSIKIM